MSRVSLSVVLCLCATVIATVVIAAPAGPPPDLSHLHLSSGPISPPSIDSFEPARPVNGLEHIRPIPNPWPYSTPFPNPPTNPNPTGTKVDVYSSDTGWNAAGILLVAVFIVLKLFGL